MIYYRTGIFGCFTDIARTILPIGNTKPKQLTPIHRLLNHESPLLHTSPNAKRTVLFWREKCRYPGDDEIVFPSRRGGPLESHNYLQRVLKSKGKEVGIADITFQALRRTFATQVHGIGTVKDAQTQLRHSTATTTMNVYTQEIPSSVKATVEALHLDQNFLGF